MRKDHLHSLLSLAWTAHSITFASCFAITSSNTPKKKQITNQSKPPGGFAKNPSDFAPITHATDDSSTTQNLIRFLLQWKSQGLGDDPDSGGTQVGFDSTTGIRGMYATRSFKKGEILCKIPSDCALALSDPSLTAGEEAMNVAEGALNFLNEQARGMWAPYLDTLPTREAQFDPTPDFYEEGEVERLEFPMIVNMAKERRRQILELAEREVGRTCR